MINTPVRLIAAAMCLFVAAVAGCGGDGARDFGGTGGGNTATGGGPGGHGGGAAGASGTGGSGSGGSVMGSGGRSGGTGGAGGRATGGSGGATGTGGRGSGGATGSGGSIGSGGRVGTGGTSGTGGANQANCDSIAAEYQTEMPAAKACVIAAPVAQCQIMVASALGCGMNCVIFVQEASTLNRTLDKWNAANCDSIPRLCPAIACVNPQKGQCALTTAGVPQCQNAAAATTN